MIRTCDARHRAGHAPRPAARWRFPHVAPGTWSRLIRELLLIATFAVIYEEIRGHLVQAGAAAASHALMTVSAEQHLGLFQEKAVQDVFVSHDTVTDAFNAYYGGTHFLIPVLVLAWLLFRHPAHYGRARTALAATTGLAFIVFWLFPVAPPRLLPAHFGIVDTLVTPDGSGHLDSVLISTAGDQYASMPSVHVAWAVWCTLAVYPVLRHWALRALAIAYPLLTTLVVVSTGNHYFLDVFAGALLTFVTWTVVTRAGAWLTVRIATRRVLEGRDFLWPAGAPLRLVSGWRAAVRPSPGAGRRPVPHRAAYPGIPQLRPRVNPPPPDR